VCWPQGNCTESDNGQDYLVKGSTCMGSNCIDDYCASWEYLHEYYCADSNQLAEIEVRCNDECTNGRCYN